MKTFTGRIVNPLDLKPWDIDIIDIAHHLSNESRFNGAARFFYSVAQHSVLVSEEPMPCPNRANTEVVCHARHKLLHDASEAYLRDIPRPLKSLPAFTEYREIEKRIQANIFERFGLDPQIPACVKAADDCVLLREGIELMNERYTFTPMFPSNCIITRMTPTQAKNLFLERFRFLFLEG